MRILLTGHTGFKGAWLSMLLARRGHELIGMSLDPEPGSLYESARVGEFIADDLRLDIRDAAAVRSAIKSARPDAVLHLAAQALVRKSYADPVETVRTNVIGTMNILEAVRTTPSVQAQVIVTTDKVYRNVGRAEGYREDEPLGGDDPYSASKAMTDILTQSWVHSFELPPTAIARAGNVIGGGDVSQDRLLPDLLRGFQSGVNVAIRYPQAVRPWQHVLDCIDGYVVLLEALLERRGEGEWNFGPGRESFVDVATVADLTAGMWSGAAAWSTPPGEHPHEAQLLALDAGKAERELDWRNRLPFPSSLEWTVDWTARVGAGEDPREVTLSQIEEYEALT